MKFIPEFAVNTLKLSLKFGSKFIIARQEDADLFGFNVAYDVNLLSNLCQLNFTGLGKNQAGHDQFFISLRLSHLKILSIEDCHDIKAHSIASMIRNHAPSLIAVVLRYITIMDDQNDSLQRPGWVLLLRAAYSLKERTRLFISDPHVRKAFFIDPSKHRRRDDGRFCASFVSSKKDVTGRAIAISSNIVEGDRRFEYASKIGDLHGTLDYLIHYYKERELWKEEVALRWMEKNYEQWKASLDESCRIDRWKHQKR